MPTPKTGAEKQKNRAFAGKSPSLRNAFALIPAESPPGEPGDPRKGFRLCREEN